MKVTGQWKYSSSRSIEFFIVIITLSLLVSFAVDIQTRSIIASRLSEPVIFISDARYYAMEHAAFTGEWPTSDAINANIETIPSSIDSISFMPSGSFEVSFSQESKHLYGTKLAFNLGTLNTESGFVFYRWHCGNNHEVDAYKIVSPLKSTVPTIYSRTICREYL